MNEKRLLKLAEILETVPRKLYHQGSWGTDKTPRSCGSPACALGWWAAVHTRRWALHFSGVFLKGKEFEYVDHSPMRSAELEFGLSDIEAMELFAGYGCDRAKTPKQAARYIRKFVARKRREEKQAA